MRRLVVVLAAVVLALAACGSSSSGSATPDPTLAFCPALDTYAKSLAKLEAVAETNSVEDYTNALAAAKTALAALRAVAGPFAGAQIDTLQTAQLQLEAAAAELPPNVTPAATEQALQEPLQNVIAQALLTYNAICNTHPTPSAAR
jgi:hypothetical protein